MKGIALGLLLVVLAMVQFMASPSEALGCGEVSGSLAPCISFLTQGGKPSAQCCSGVSNLRNMLKTKEDRQTACNCVKSAAASNPNIKPDAASNLPKQCGVEINIPISPNTDCHNIP